MENENSAVEKFINNNINIREKLKIEEVLGLMDIPKTVIIHNMRNNLKLEREHAIKNLTNSKSNFKETKSPIKNEKPNIQIINNNPYGANLTISKPILQSNYLYNIIKKENNFIDGENIKNSKINEIKDNKYNTINYENRRIDLKRVKEDVKKTHYDKSKIIKNIKAENKNKENSNMNMYSNTQNNRKGDLNSFLRERYENQKQKVEKEMLIKQAEDQKQILENEIKSVEKLRNAFTELLPKVMESIKVIDKKDTSEKNLNTNIIKDTKFQESEINKNTNLNLNTFTTNSNLRNNPITTNNNKNIASSRNNSNRNLTNTNKNYYKKPAYEDEYEPNDLFYNPKKNYFVRNKYKKLLQ